MSRVLSVCMLALALLLAARSEASAAGDAAKGGVLLTKKGCTSCHSLDGSPQSGPTFLGLYGAKRTVITAGEPREVVADDAYLARALREPDADVVTGFTAGRMPRFALGDDDAASIARAIEALGPASTSGPAAAPARSSRSLVFLTLSALWFVGLHLLLSSIPVRRQLLAALKPGGFSLVYSLVATLGLVGIVVFFRSSPYVEIWQPPRAHRWVPVLVMPVAILFMVAGFSTPNPTSVGQAKLASEEGAVRGIFTVTRHPALWGFALWATAHLFANGELRAIVVFVAILALALAGMRHIDIRRAAELGADWKTYADRTSIVPFAAIASGRTRLDLRGIGVVRTAAAAFTYVAILHTHALLIGASPMP